MGDKVEERNDNFVIGYEAESTGIENEIIEDDVQIRKPFNPNDIRVDSNSMSLDILIGRLREGEIDLMPDFQRKGGIWSNKTQSRLIESILIRIPLPAFYLDAADDDKWIVIDGLQRLTTLKRFAVDKDLKLVGLEFLTEYEGKYYDELPRSLHRRINETQVIVYSLQKDTPLKAKYNIFKRINTGGLPLSSQEIRHALNQGEATKTLIRLSKSKQFLEATSNSVKDERMGAREMILRYLAFTLRPYTEYDGDLDNFLVNTMERINIMNGNDIKSLEKKFINAMVIAYKLFAQYTFRKIYDFKEFRTYPINKALFESWSVNFNGLSKAQETKLIENKDAVKIKFIKIMNEYEFEKSISQATGNIKNVHYRFSKINDIIKNILS